VEVAPVVLLAVTAALVASAALLALAARWSSEASATARRLGRPCPDPSPLDGAADDLARSVEVRHPR
jgi:hypothetical protein